LEKEYFIIPFHEKKKNLYYEKYLYKLLEEETNYISKRKEEHKM
jgi:hypothetical protein